LLNFFLIKNFLLFLAQDSLQRGGEKNSPFSDIFKGSFYGGGNEIFIIIIIILSWMGIIALPNR
jgi:hypothetical protein